MNTSFRKKRRIFLLSLSIVFVLVVLFFVTLLLTTLSENARPYPLEKDSRWVSSDPYFVLNYKYVHDELLEQNAILEINGEFQEVEVDYRRGVFLVVLPASKTGDYDEVLFSGTWKYRGDKLVFNIKHDYIFDGAYKEIVFEPDNGTEQNTQLE